MCRFNPAAAKTIKIMMTNMAIRPVEPNFPFPDRSGEALLRVGATSADGATLSFFSLGFEGAVLSMVYSPNFP
jgi:hypothetical protein